MSEDILGDADEAEIQVEISNLLLIVVGAHLRAEVADRPLAYRLRDKIVDWLREHASAMNVLLAPLVCSDVWYINQKALHARPTICIGGPGVNALSAYYANQLTSALVHDDKMVIQMDIEHVDLRICIWGMDHDLTVEALNLFMHKYLDSYLRAAVTQVEPHEG